MANVCTQCGAKLSFTQRLSGKSVCPDCSMDGKQERPGAEQAYRALLAQIITAKSNPSEIESQRLAVLERGGLADRKVQRLNLEYFRSLVETVLQDDYVTEDEESLMFGVGHVLEIEQDVFDQQCEDLKLRLYVARVNDGRIPVLENPNIMLKKGEIAHMSVEADLLKEVAVREYQGGYGGFSFRVMKGVRFHTGSTRGRSVVVGTRIETADKGVLTITSQRAVFAGLRQSLEIPYAKLLNMNVFNDGVQFHVSNRKNAPVFRLTQGMGNVIAATINATCQ